MRNKEQSGTEQLPADVMTRMLGSRDIRVAILEHPVTKEMAPCVPYLDYAEAFSYDHTAIFKMIERTSWIKKHSSIAIMATEGGGYRPHVCLFEEGALGLFFKLQPKRCKDPAVAERVDQLQEELILILRDALKGFRTSHGGYSSPDGKLPNPGLSMDSIGALCREVDKYLKGKASLRALNYFTGMPVEDLIDELEAQEIPRSHIAGIIAQCLRFTADENITQYGLEIEKTEGGFVIEGSTQAFYQTFLELARRHNLPRFFGSAVSFGNILGKEADAVEGLGWPRSYKKIQGYRIYRYEFRKDN